MRPHIVRARPQSRRRRVGAPADAERLPGRRLGWRTHGRPRPDVRRRPARREPRCRADDLRPAALREHRHGRPAVRPAAVLADARPAAQRRTAPRVPRCLAPRGHLPRGARARRNRRRRRHHSAHADGVAGAAAAEHRWRYVRVARRRNPRLARRDRAFCRAADDGHDRYRADRRPLPTAADGRLPRAREPDLQDRDPRRRRARHRDLQVVARQRLGRDPRRRAGIEHDAAARHRR